MIDNKWEEYYFPKQEHKLPLETGIKSIAGHISTRTAHTHITRTFSAVLLTDDLAAYVYNAADAYTRYTVIACGLFLIFVDF